MDNIINRYNQIANGIAEFRDEDIDVFFPNPKESDYNVGYINRFFIQKANDKGSPIFEVNSIEFKKVKKNKLLDGVSLRWRIKGELEPTYDEKGNMIDKAVSESNRLAIKRHNSVMPNLKLYLPNLLQFYKK